MTTKTTEQLPIQRTVVTPKSILETEELEDNVTYLVDPEFEGNQVLITTPDGDLVEATSLTGYTSTGTITLKCVDGVLQWVPG